LGADLRGHRCVCVCWAAPWGVAHWCGGMPREPTGSLCSSTARCARLRCSGRGSWRDDAWTAVAHTIIEAWERRPQRLARGGRPVGLGCSERAHARRCSASVSAWSLGFVKRAPHAPPCTPGFIYASELAEHAVLHEHERETQAQILRRIHPPRVHEVVIALLELGEEVPRNRRCANRARVSSRCRAEHRLPVKLGGAYRDRAREDRRCSTPPPLPVPAHTISSARSWPQTPQTTWTSTVHTSDRLTGAGKTSLRCSWASIAISYAHAANAWVGSPFATDPGDSLKWLDMFLGIQILFLDGEARKGLKSNCHCRWDQQPTKCVCAQDRKIGYG